MKLDKEGIIPYKFVNFSVNKEKRIVVCFLDKSKCSPWRMLNDIVFNHLGLCLDKKEYNIDDMFANSIIRYMDKKIIPRQQCVGVAKCHPNDEFDEVRGKQIAYSRLNAKVARHCRSCLNKIVEHRIVPAKAFLDTFIANYDI